MLLFKNINFCINVIFLLIYVQYVAKYDTTNDSTRCLLAVKGRISAWQGRGQRPPSLNGKRAKYFATEQDRSFLTTKLKYKYEQMNHGNPSFIITTKLSTKT